MRYHNVSVEAGDDLHSNLMACLIRRPVFRKHELRLFCGVPVQELTYQGEPAPLAADEYWRFDYLVCQGSAALLSINLTPEQQEDDMLRPILPGFLMLSFPRESAEENGLEGMLSAVEQALTTMLDEGVHTKWGFSGTPVSPRLYQVWARAHLLEKKGEDCRWKPKYWQPTQYGWDCGLMLGCVYTTADAREADGTRKYLIRRAPYYSRRIRPVLEDILRWRTEAASGPEWEKEAPLDQTIRRLRQGLPGDRAFSAHIVRQMADLPLDSYLCGFPEDLAQLRRTLPALQSGATYQDAAVLIYRNYRAYWTEKAAAWIDQKDECRRLMQILAKPLLEEWSRIQEELRGG